MTPPGQDSEEARQGPDIRRVLDTIPTLAWSARSDGSADFFNRRWLDFTGLSVEQLTQKLRELPAMCQDLVFENVQARMRTSLLIPVSPYT